MPATKKSTRLYAIVGSDEASVKEAATTLARRLSPDNEFATDVIDGVADHADGAATRVHAAIEALLTFPFFGGEKFVWLKNANFLGDTPTGRAAAVIGALEKLIATLQGGLPENTSFLLSATEIDKRRSFYKQLQKLAKVEVHDALDTSRPGWEEEAALLVRQAAHDRGLTFAGEAVDIFTLCTGGDRRTIATEFEKLDLFLGRERREIMAEDVRQLVGMSRASVVFELGNALAERQLQRALVLLDQLLFQGENEVGILLVAIIPTVRNLLLAKDLMERHRLARPQQPFFFGKTLERLPTDALAHLPRKKDGSVNMYGLGLGAAHAHRFTMIELRAAFDACLEANVQLVSSSLDRKVILTRLLVRIIARGSSSSSS
jgi:DNA polymerase III subunit delta